MHLPIKDTEEDVAKELEVERRLRDVMSAVFGVEAAKISSADSPDTVAEWSSLGHLQLMLALEQEFDIQFEPDELASLRTVGMIENRLAGSYSE